MTKQKQIVEMVKIIDEMYNVYTTQADDIAEGLYNADYQKPFTSDIASVTQKAYKEGCEKRVKKQRKRFCNDLYFNLQSSVKGNVWKSNDYYNVMGWIEEIAKEYGVEVEE